MRFRQQSFRQILGIFMLGCSSASLRAAEEGDHFFESRIRPVLVKHCYECHSVESGKSKGSLRVDTRESIRAGGDTGAAVIPGDPENSLLLTALRHGEPDLEMPPKKEKLPESIAADFEEWIRQGAPDPRENSATTGAGDFDRDERLDHWSYRPPVSPAPPEVTSDWPLTAIDRFVFARLTESGLTPSADASPAVFARRLYLDLTGLPPTPEEAASFSYDSLEATVEDLLSSSDFGVRWGRHWLDVVRFAESNGREANIAYPHAWRFRDYVIDSLNGDLPYDRFLLEQVAGDLLPADTDAERARLLIATGFLALGPKGLNSQEKEQFAADLIDEQLDALSRGFLASSLACARCHDHKADPVSIEDYYALIGIFKSSKTYYGTWVDSENNNGGELITLPDLPGQLKPGTPIPEARLAQMKQQLADLDEQERQSKEIAEKARADGVDLRGDFNEMLREALRIYWSRGGLVGKLAEVDDSGQPLPLCMGMKDAETAQDSPVYLRGELKSPDKIVPRGVPSLFGMEPAPPATSDQSGRLALGHWLSQDDNPLTSRVMANRVWGHLMGTGLVRTTDDFGHTGEAPSHPELLDWLAVSFRDGGWSVKKLIREIVLSRTYRQASDYRADSFLADPDNRLFWRLNPRRLDAEVIRDSMLAVSGELDRSPRSGSLAANLRSHSVSLIGFDPNVPTDLDGVFHRSAYLPIFRENLPDVLELFDFAEPSLVVGDRDETNVPLQALYLMNSSFVRERSLALAKRLIGEATSPSDRIHRAFDICFHRAPDSAELALSLQFLEDTLSDGVEETEATARFCQTLLSSAEFRLVD